MSDITASRTAGRVTLVNCAALGTPPCAFILTEDGQRRHLRTSDLEALADDLARILDDGYVPRHARAEG